MPYTLNRSELIALLAQAMPSIPAAQVEAAVKTLLNALAESLASGQRTADRDCISANPWQPENQSIRLVSNCAWITPMRSPNFQSANSPSRQEDGGGKAYWGVFPQQCENQLYDKLRKQAENIVDRLVSLATESFLAWAEIDLDLPGLQRLKHRFNGPCQVNSRENILVVNGGLKYALDRLEELVAGGHKTLLFADSPGNLAQIGAAFRKPANPLRLNDGCNDPGDDRRAVIQDQRTRDRHGGGDDGLLDDTHGDADNKDGKRKHPAQSAPVASRSVW